MTVFAYECWHKRYPDRRTVVNAATRDQARYQYFLDLQDAWGEANYVDVRAKKVGAPQASNMFRHVATSRGLPFVRAGMRVECDDRTGFIVDAGGGANFKVYFPDQKTFGYCHPLWKMRYFDTDGKLIRDTTQGDS